MSTPSKKTSVYDYVVVGSGLAGLSVATALSKSGAEVLLLEASEQAGGLHHAVKTKVGPSENGLRFLPDTELSRRGLEFLSSLTGEEIRFESVERAPQTYDSTGLHEFLGFGNDAPEFYDELSYFLNPRELVLEKPLHYWVQKLVENFTGELSTRSYVTKFHFNEGKIHSMTINGQKTLQALNIIYAGPLKSLPILLPDAALPAKARQKLAKAKFWTGIGIDIVHSRPVAEYMGLHVLNGTTQDDIGPCVGRFMPAQEQEDGTKLQFSQWLSFVDDEDAEDTEKIGVALKKIKRQIKRAYPEAFEGQVSERILVVPSVAGGELKLTGHQTLPLANNFWVATGAVHERKNLLGTIEQVQLVTSALGVNPLGAALDTASEATSPEGLSEEEFSN